MTRESDKKNRTRALPQSVVRSWQLQTAKARLSELVRLAQDEGPQLITRQGKSEVVVLPIDQFETLVARAKQPLSIVQFFAQSPLVGLDLDLERDKDAGRSIEL